MTILANSALVAGETTLSRKKVHYRSIRLFVNAGMEFPQCYAHAALLDLDKARLLTTFDKELVTCSRCLRKLKGE